METLKNSNPRRDFLGKLALGASFLGLGNLFSSEAKAGTPEPVASSAEHPAEQWFNQIKGKHKVVFDATEPHDIFPFAWPKVFLMTNGLTGSPASDCSVVVVLRHSAIGYAMDNSVWQKYSLGKVFHAEDPKTKEDSTRNPFWKPAADDFKVPGIGAVQIGINDLQAQGVMFCVCEAAMTVYSAVIADKMKMDAAEIRKDFVASLLPGIQQVPSGVWALGRAQEKGCAYIFAG